MDEIEDIETIDVELDEDLKRKEVARCKDEFLNTLCADEDDENQTAGVPVVDKKNGAGSSSTRRQQIEEEKSKEKFHYATLNPKNKWNSMRPAEGERYENPHQLKLCLTNYSISKGFQVRFRKCDRIRLVVVCAREPDTFPFIVRAYWMSTEHSFQIKKMTDKHSCVRNFNNSKLLGPTWLGRQFLKELIRQPDLKCKAMQSIALSKYKCNLSWSKCYRARMRALSLIHGKLSDHYARVWDYRHELLRSNPGSTVEVCVTDNPDNTTTFQRIYICFKAIRERWVRGCRRVIGLDGCFLKGQCKGELLTAIGRDGNNQVYPIAWAVVEVENKASWKWFLDLVARDLNLHDGSGMCVISDQHKGLIEASKEILPKCEHRQCARHIFANFRKSWSGIEFSAHKPFDLD